MTVTDVVKGQTIVTHTINADNFKHCLMTFGEKMTEAEIDDVFDEFDYDDDGLILTKSVVDMFVAGGMDEKEDDKKKKEEEEKKKKEAEAKAAAEGFFMRVIWIWGWIVGRYSALSTGFDRLKCLT